MLRSARFETLSKFNASFELNFVFMVSNDLPSRLVLNSFLHTFQTLANTVYSTEREEPGLR